MIGLLIRKIEEAVVVFLTLRTIYKLSMTLNKQIIIGQLKQHKPAIEKFGVSSVGLFGSYVRNEQRDDSDVDILIQLKEDKSTLDNFLNVCWLLDELFPGKKVEVATQNGLNKRLRPFILNEVEYV
jgi:predicted nucleotidyltransferase